MILVGCLFGFLGDAIGGVFDKAFNVVTGAGDLLTGGAVSEWTNKATRNANMADWKEQQSVLDQYQKGMVDYQNNANLAYNKELMSFQNDATKDMTQYMYDRYQSPEAKMNALKSAGINPNLVAGSLAGTNIGATASSSSSGGSAGNIASAPGNNMNRAQLNPMLAGQIEYQNEVNKMAKLKNEEQALLNDKLRKEQPYWEQNAENQAKTLMYGVSISENTAKEIGEKIKNLQKEYEYLDRQITNAHILGNKMAQEANNLVTQDLFIKASIAEKWAMLRKIDNDISVGRATIVMLMSQSGFYESMSKLNDAQRLFVLETIAGVKTDNEMKEINKKMLEWKERTQVASQTWGVIQDIVGMVSAFMPFCAGYRSSNTTTFIDGNSYPPRNPVGFK